MVDLERRRPGWRATTYLGDLPVGVPGPLFEDSPGLLNAWRRYRTSPDILCWVTHSRPKSATIDDYTTLVWNPLCQEVAKLRIVLRLPASSVPAAIANSAKSAASASDLATGFATGSEVENDFLLLSLRGGRDLNPRPPA
jgi:hypothetical protein